MKSQRQKQCCPAVWLWLELLAACDVGSCDSFLSAKWKPVNGIPQVGHEGHTTCWIPGIVRTDEISDHYFTFVLTLTTNKIKQNTKSKVRRRDMKNFSSTKLKRWSWKLVSWLHERLNRLPIIVNENNINTIFANFYDKYIGVLDKHAPYKNLTGKQTKLTNKPWISKGILVSI